MSTFLLALVMFCFPVSLSLAQQSNDASEIMLKEALKGVANETLRPYVKSKVNQVIFIKFGGTEAVPNGAGSTALAVVDFAMAADDAIKSETDKGKLYAGARAANSYITLVNPPVGAIVSAVIFVTSLADGILDAKAAEETMKIQKIIADHYRGIQNIHISFAKSDIARMETTLTMLIEAKEAYKTINEEISQHCSREDKIDTGVILKFCVARVVHVAAALNTIARLSEYLLEFQTLAFDREKFFADNKIDLIQYRDEIKSIKLKASVAEDKIQVFLAGYSRMLYEKAIETANYEGLPDIQESFINACYTKSLNLVRKKVMMGEHDFPVSLEIADVLGKMDEASFRQELRFFFSEPCLDQSNQNSPLYPSLIKNIQILKGLSK